MKKILNHLFNGGILVSPGGHTLFTEKLGLIISQNGEKTHIESSMEIIDLFLQYDWEIHREPGVYRVADEQGGTVELWSFDGNHWYDPCYQGAKHNTPNIIIERVEAEPTQMKSHITPEYIADQKGRNHEASAMADMLDGSVMDRLQQMAGGFVPDWGDNGQSKYFLRYDNDEKKWEFTEYTYLQMPGVVYFATKAKAQNAINQLGEELLG